MNYLDIAGKIVFWGIVFVVALGGLDAVNKYVAYLHKKMGTDDKSLWLVDELAETAIKAAYQIYKDGFAELSNDELNKKRFEYVYDILSAEYPLLGNSILKAVIEKNVFDLKRKLFENKVGSDGVVINNTVTPAVEPIPVSQVSIPYPVSDMVMRY